MILARFVVMYDEIYLRILKPYEVFLCNGKAHITVAENLPEDYFYQSLKKILSAMGSVKTMRSCYHQNPQMHCSINL
ncbi:la-related protein 6B-like [Typha angustifolia]|uniref:la-related protein 6B-like n=1 Tax=Typha angustifolia TaxID=59011 RepID=UPI003C30119D